MSNLLATTPRSIHSGTVGAIISSKTQGSPWLFVTYFANVETFEIIIRSADHLGFTIVGWPSKSFPPFIVLEGCFRTTANLLEPATAAAS